ncbi:hypothetical protein QFZ41_000418 [Luteibacter sp. W1I16]|uniref:hypothetical protein n=1 Tax=Luteibacter sp. W1I16 TaxID=3373922 RepID=UPI003D22D385
MRLPVLVRSRLRGRPRDPSMEAVAIASRLEPDPALRDDWFHHDPIRELRGMTAERAIASGKAGELVRLLRSIEAGRRGR